MQTLQSGRTGGAADGLVMEALLDRELTPAGVKRAFRTFPTGVTAIAGLVDAAPVGMTASSFTWVSLDPPLASVCIAVTSTTWPRLCRAGRFGISVLGRHQEEVGRQLAALGVDRFAGLAWQPTEDGAVLLDGASAWFVCSLERQMPAGDHHLVLLRVRRVGRNPHVGPLVSRGGHQPGEEVAR